MAASISCVACVTEKRNRFEFNKPYQYFHIDVLSSLFSGSKPFSKMQIV